jgi:uridine phosphorylase
MASSGTSLRSRPYGFIGCFLGPAPGPVAPLQSLVKPPGQPRRANAFASFLEKKKLSNPKAVNTLLGTTDFSAKPILEGCYFLGPAPDPVAPLRGVLVKPPGQPRRANAFASFLEKKKLSKQKAVNTLLGTTDFSAKPILEGCYFLGPAPDPLAPLRGVW